MLNWLLVVILPQALTTRELLPSQKNVKHYFEFLIVYTIIFIFS